MMLIAFTDFLGRVNPPAAFVNALLIQGLYNQDQTPFNLYANVVGGQVLAFSSNLSSYPPDYGVIRVGDQVLIVVAGTTNAPQWAFHVASAIFPNVDTDLDAPVIGSFYRGAQEIFGTLIPFMPAADSGGKLLIAGHSYGAAAATIISLNRQQVVPSVPIDLMTFGEPYSYGTPSTLPTLNSHNRLVSCLTDDFNPDDPIGIDPVSLSPPPALQFLKFAIPISFAAGLLGLRWKHTGQRQIITDTNIYPPVTPSVANNIPYIADGQFVANLPYAFEHLVNPSYLSKCLSAYQRGPQIPSLQPLVGLALQYLGVSSNLPDNLAPPIAASIINSAWGLPTGTITEANRTDFSTVSLAGSISFPGESAMPNSIYVTPTFKGTLFFDQDEGGSSESFFAAPPNTLAPPPSNSQAGAAPTTYAAMMVAMRNVAQARLRLSQTQDNPLCNNPLILKAIRIEDERLNRDSLLDPNPFILGPGYTTGSAPDLGAAANENDAINAAYKCNLVDGNGHTSQYYFHGVPIYSMNQPGGSTTNPPLAFEERVAVVRSSWQQNMWNLCNTCIQNGVGFRFQWPCWTPGGLGNGGYPGTGNGTPISAYYNFPGKPLNTYTFGLVDNPPPPAGSPPASMCQNPLGKFRVIIRGMKQLKVLNGRWAAFGFQYAGGVSLPPAGYYLNVQRRAANYLTDTTGNWDGYGYLSPEVWSVVQPAPAPPWVTTAPTGIQGPIYTTKKCGRPFDLARGRRRNTVT